MLKLLAMRQAVKSARAAGSGEEGKTGRQLLTLSGWAEKKMSRPSLIGRLTLRRVSGVYG